MATSTQARSPQASRATTRTDTRKRFSERVGAQAERFMQLQLGAVLRAKDSVSTTTPASLRKRVERELTAAERRGAAGQKVISRELQRRREQLARIARRATPST